MNKRVVSVVLVIVCVFSLCVGAFAAANSKSISALLSFGTQIKFNGVVQEFKDVTGKTVYPIMFEGSTYLPVRAVCGLANIPVDWDSATGTVLLGEKDKTPVTDGIYKNAPSIWTKAKTTIDPTELVIVGEAYDYGIVASSTSSANYEGQGWQVGFFETKSKYSTLHIKALCRDSKSATLYFLKDSDNGMVLKEVNLSSGIPQDVEINVVGCEKVYVTLHQDKEDINTPVVITDMYLK